MHQTHCESTRKPPYNAGALIIILVCCVFAVLVIASSLVDIILHFQKKVEDKNKQIQDETETKQSMKHPKLVEFITAFSLFKVIP